MANFFDQSAGNPPAPAPAGPWMKYQAAPKAGRPWEKYQAAPEAAGPWTKYQSTPAEGAATGTPSAPDPRYHTRFVTAPNPAAMAGVPMPIPIPPIEQQGTPAPAAEDSDGGMGRWLGDVAASAADGIREGFTALPDMAVQAVDQAPRILNLPKMIPGMEDAYGDVGTVTEGGHAFWNWAMGDGEFTVPEGADTRPVTLRDVTGGFGTLDYQPQTGAGRFANRVGQELGASALPAGAAVAYGSRFVPAAGAPAAHEGVRQLVEPFVRNPGAALAREAAGATAAGVGAATVNAAHDAVTGGVGGAWWTDLLGGIGGLGVAGAVEGLGRTSADIYRRVGNDPRHQQQIAGEAVVDRLVDNSTTMQAERFAGRPLDAEVLAQRIDQPTTLEELVPGYRAGTADRSGDSDLRSLAYNTESLAPGAANVRRERNMAAVGDHIRGLLPDGDGAAFLDRVRTAAAGMVDSAQAATGAARNHFDEALDAVRPRMQPIDRGQAIRDDMTGVFNDRTAKYRQAYDARDAAMTGDRIPAGAPYRALQDEARRLTTYERDAYVPADIMASARTLAPEAAPPPAQPTGVLDLFGNPVVRAREVPPAEIPLSEALALRHGLTTRQREAAAAGRAPEHRVMTRLGDRLRNEIEDAMSPETRALDARARELRRGVAADFEDGNLPSRILDQTARGRDQLPAETIAPRVTASETPYRDIMRLVGARDGTRAAVRDQILADAQNAGALRNQDTLNRFFADRAYALGDFPEARAGLEAAGAGRAALDQAEAFARAQQARYAPGSNSPVGRFTRHDATGVADALRGVWKSAEPTKAVREVLDTAGRTPENLKNARAAFFEDMARTTTNSAHDAAGNIVWNGRVLDGFLKNPKVRVVMDELWAGDGPRKHLDDLRAIGAALIDSESALRARPASSSGTASISLQGKVDPALTATSVASTLRSVSRGQLSKPIAGVHLLSGWIRGRSSRVQAAAINELMTKAMDDPKLAAELLRKYNPYEAQVMGRRFLRKYGVRVPQLANIINNEVGGYSDGEQAFDAYMGAD